MPKDTDHDIGDDSPLNVRTNGRLVPTTPWDAGWHASAQWADVPEDQMKHILPNIDNWDKDQHFLTKENMFKNA